MEIQIKREYNYSDVYLVPNKCIVGSRSECDVTQKLGKHTFSLPVIAANMPSVIDEKTCEFFCKHNMFYTMHRFNNINQVKFIDRMASQNFISSISIGINDESYAQLSQIKEAKLEPDYITIDVAHAFSEKCKRMIGVVREKFPDTFLIVGNGTTREFVEFVSDCGASCCRVFIGPGASCITKVFTGFTRGTISTLIDCVGSPIPIIADGGVREIGDVAKALAISANFVMAGHLFAGYDESSGDTIEHDGKKYKKYYGNASEDNKKRNSDSVKNVEGKTILVEHKGEMQNLIKTLSESLKSSVSYSGGDNLDSLRNCRLIAIN